MLQIRREGNNASTWSNMMNALVEGLPAFRKFFEELLFDQVGVSMARRGATWPPTGSRASAGATGLGRAPERLRGRVGALPACARPNAREPASLGGKRALGVVRAGQARQRLSAL